MGEMFSEKHWRARAAVALVGATLASRPPWWRPFARASWRREVAERVEYAELEVGRLSEVDPAAARRESRRMNEALDAARGGR